VNGVFLFAQLCGNGVWMGTKSTVTGRGWGQNEAKGARTGWRRVQEYILRGGNGVKHLTPCHSLLPTNLQNFTQKYLTGVKIFQKIVGGATFLNTLYFRTDEQMLLASRLFMLGQNSQNWNNKIISRDLKSDRGHMIT